MNRNQKEEKRKTMKEITGQRWKKLEDDFIARKRRKIKEQTWNI